MTRTQDLIMCNVVKRYSMTFDPTGEDALYCKSWELPYHNLLTSPNCLYSFDPPSCWTPFFCCLVFSHSLSLLCKRAHRENTIFKDVTRCHTPLHLSYLALSMVYSKQSPSQNNKVERNLYMCLPH